MNEKLLQYLWNYKVFNSLDFRDTAGNTIEILEFGKWNQDSGADFLFAKIRHNGLTLAGNIELHVKTSDWIFHRHSENPDFENVILHAVFEHDLDIEAISEKNIPTLELKSYISDETLKKYQLLLNEISFIPCEEIFTPDKIPFGFHDESLLNRLEQKSVEIEFQMRQQRNDYEAVLFHNIAYAFGLRVNAEIFRQIAETVNFQIVRKISQNNEQLEALFFGLSNWLQKPTDAQMKKWKTEFDFFTKKYGIPKSTLRPKFLRLRPPNFPTLRMSQLANLYHKHQNLFSKIMQAQTVEQLYQIFEGVKASGYWNKRFNFGNESELDYEKKVSEKFIELIIINAILPLKYTYHKHQNENIADEILGFYAKLPAEENTIIFNWKKLGCEIPSALESQALLYHYQHFCLKKNCLNCAIGLKLLQ